MSGPPNTFLASGAPLAGAIRKHAARETNIGWGSGPPDDEPACPAPPDHQEVYSRRLDRSDLLAAVALVVFFAWCLPERSTADHAALSAAQPAIIVLSPAHFDPSDDETDVAPAGFPPARCATWHDGRTSSIQEGRRRYS